MAKSEAVSEEGILSLLQSEWTSAQGFGDELSEDRARAYDYLYADPNEGYLAEDLPPERGRSQAVDTSVSDAIETILPDLIEIFTAGDDVVSFTPRDRSDEEQAQSETTAINYVFYHHNQGWKLIYDNFKDALASKTGIFKWWWEECDDWSYEVFEGLTKEGLQVALSELRKAGGELADKEEDDLEPDPETGLYTVRVKRKEEYGKARVACVAPEDFRIDRNATSLCDATWAGHSARPRAYELIEQGFDEDKVAELQNFDVQVLTEDQQARSSTDDDQAKPAPVYEQDLMRRVEIREYHIWMDADGSGDIKCWRIITGNADKVLLSKEEIEHIQFSATCPYPTTHRFYGRSLADLLIETQKIKTALKRLALDAYYFGVNPRPEVDITKCTEFTMSDLMENKPGRPYRVKGENAVNWKSPPVVGDAVLPFMEFVSTEAEQRTGVVRNAQGLNPDTLHDTAKGALELMSAAQRRIRMIARIFAETGVKDLFLGVHKLLVHHATDKMSIPTGPKKWLDVDPGQWKPRQDITIEVGLGSSTKSAEISFWTGYLTILQNAAASGIEIGTDHVFNAVKRLLRAGNVKNPELYFPDPDEQGQQQQQPQPNPDVIKAQGEMQIKQQKAQSDIKLDWAKFQFESQLAKVRMFSELGLAEKAQQAEQELAATQQLIETHLAEKRQDAETSIAGFKAAHDAQVKHLAAGAKAKLDRESAKISRVRFGGQVG